MNKREFNVGDKVWAYAFYRLGGKTGKLHNIKPVYGLLVGYGGVKNLDKNNTARMIIPYKISKGKVTDVLCENKSYNLCEVYLAETYEEAVEQYNIHVNKEISFYEEQLNKVKACLIKEE